ncbi:hypothetical protein [Pseudoxanthomonas winnipegensis]|uniref:Uncharacterized protein n=1 Tax=Pseudoxanthomonas winnipegensis TaxID=2480810 RepID=A0A4Q8LXU4_9GAMM|nr:hypothetical protein [Pseudoxanthomonas winnipegensis]RZZ90588.1 hypothetical protein EA663_02200 [Pseudoxanthomonas winnipegensis]TAA08575.1 hypothetical protein EA659_11955 [Pseudoxanthomonas winnipegensis]TAA16086.1 hypothetical protein EA658_20955 [Pseudoxanthomonas winnipegensis]TAA37256.1 hypothetical protein EA656_00840 [Pseudoxanthomonas winnipegensis]TAH72069.1 hypothetical protein EA657_13270 [Pseudoxanthomonas winnipegensis]
MATGLKVWDNGALVLDVTDRLTRVAGQVSIPANGSGSVTCPEGTPWYTLYLLDQNEPGSLYGVPAPQVTVSGSTITWGIKSGASASQACTLTYGAY